MFEVEEWLHSRIGLNFPVRLEPNATSGGFVRKSREVLIPYYPCDRN